MKKFLIAVGALCSLALLTGCGGTKTADVPADTNTTVDTTTTTTSTTTTTKIDATKDQCMEITVYGMKAAVAQMSGDTVAANTWAQKGGDLENQLIAGNVEYEQACSKYMTDQDFIKDIQKSLQEK